MPAIGENAMPRIEPFEAFSEEYDRWFESHTEAYELELRAVKALIPSGAGGLEVGVGSGKFAAPLGVGTGVEPSARMAARAKVLGIQVLKGVAESLPVADQCVDFVLLVTTICFVDDVDATLWEALRVLKPDGFIVVGFVDRESELGRKYMRLKDRSRFYKPATFFSTTEVLDHLNRAGFWHFQIKQTLIPGNSGQPIEDGFGKGSFVVIKGVKKGPDA